MGPGIKRESSQRKGGEKKDVAYEAFGGEEKRNLEKKERKDSANVVEEKERLEAERRGKKAPFQ